MGGLLFETIQALDRINWKYREFYDEWVNTYQNTFGKFYPIPTLKSNKETLEKFISSAEESDKLYKSWTSELEENSRKTKEDLQGGPPKSMIRG